MDRPSMTVAEAKEQLDKMIARKLNQRRGLCEVAISAGAPRARGIVAEVEAGRFPWWPELAPLTKAERVAVYRAIAAGLAAGSADVD